MARAIAGIDLGGTKIFGARVRRDADGATVSDETKRSTPNTSVDDIVSAIVDVVGELGSTPEVVGIGTPGVIAPGSGVVEYAPNLAGFDRPVPLAERVAEAVGVPVVIGNDVNMAALGEARLGAGQRSADVLAVWMGTGLGAGLIVDGRLRVGPNGLAGELGHTVVVPGGRPCACGGRGHLEAYIGRRALETRARELHASGRPTDSSRRHQLLVRVERRAERPGMVAERRLDDRGPCTGVVERRQAVAEPVDHDRPEPFAEPAADDDGRDVDTTRTLATA